MKILKGFYISLVLFLVFWPMLAAQADPEFNFPQTAAGFTAEGGGKCIFYLGGGCDKAGWYANPASNCSWEPCCKTHMNGYPVDDYTYAWRGKCANKTLSWGYEFETPDKSKCHQGYDCCCPTAPTAPSAATKSTTVEVPKFDIPQLQIDIPTVKLSSTTCTTTDNGSYTCQIPWLAEYVVGLYNYGLAIAGILAAIILMAGGVLWLVSGGDASRITQAKELIIGSVTGLIILVSAYVLLGQINPDLNQLKPLTVGTIKALELVENGSDSDSNVTSGPCSSDANLASINGLGLGAVSASDPRLTKNADEGLKKAIDLAKQQNVKITVTSANRTYAKQKELWDAELKKQNGNEALTRKYVAPPSQCQGNSCYSHCAGVAIDACLTGTASCSHISGASNANYSDADVVKLQKIMQAAGWKRYCGEWWHFQYGQNPGISCSP